ncbi:MAG: hypothetical protein ACFFD5_00510 [Candidatus Thorarchaeota archaeon]
MKDLDNDKKIQDPKVLEDFEELLNKNRLDFLGSSNPNKIVKSLTSPRFLGSYHLKTDINPQFKSFQRLIKGEIDLKSTKALRSIVFNPLTITLIIIAFVFNLFLLFFSIL